MNYATLNQPPLISVIIISYLRKNFIKIAFDSAVNQSLSRDYYEIIVIKNFIDEEIDNYIEGNGGKNIYTDAQPLGDKCVIGIENSKGKILVFLEDDDILLYEKLQKIMEAFGMKNVVYFHNNHFLINQDGRIVDGSMFPQVKKNTTIEIEKASYKDIGQILRHGGSFNLSSIAIRSSILQNSLSYLKGMNVAVDNFMFYLAIASKGCLIIDSQKLTSYRLHGENSSIPADKDTNSLLIRAMDFLKSDIYGYTSILNAINDPFIRQVVQCRILAPKMNMHIIDKSSAFITASDYGEALKCGIRMRNKEILILLLVDLFSRRYKYIGRHIYGRYLRRRSDLLSMKI
jgi:glycosyltransferase involved in cell wall biosynthesis